MVKLKCAKCGSHMIYQGTAGAWDVYSCPHQEDVVRVYVERPPDTHKRSMDKVELALLHAETYIRRLTDIEAKQLHDRITDAILAIRRLPAYSDGVTEEGQDPSGDPQPTD